jgi:hypothetical protein
VKKLKIFSSPLFLSLFLYLILQLTVINIFTGVWDEGFFLYNAHLIAKGAIPYKDFFMTTTPGSSYVLAFFFKLFGNYDIVTKILGISTGVLTLVFSDKLFTLFSFKSRWWQYVYLFSIALLNIAVGRSLFYGDAVLFAFFALYFLLIGSERNSMFLIGIAGFFGGVCFVFKQSVGGLLFPALLIGLFLVSNRKSVVRSLAAFIIGEAAVLVPASAYFILNSAFSQALYYTFTFASAVKSHSSSFLLHRLIAIPIIVLLLRLFFRLNSRMKLLLLFVTLSVSLVYLLLNMRRIGRLVDYLPDPTFYVLTAVFLFAIIMLSVSLYKMNTQKRRITLVAITLLVIFLSIGASGYSMGPAIVVSPLLIPLLIFVSETYGKRVVKNPMVVSLITVSVIVIYTVPFVSRLDRPIGTYLNSQFSQSLRVKEAAYIRFLPTQAQDLTEIITYIHKATKKDEKIFCFPHCPGLYFFAERESGSYFTLFYFETFMVKDQGAVIRDLQKNNVRLVILQKTGDIDPHSYLDAERLPKIQGYVLRNYAKVFETPNFIALQRRI